MQALKDHIERRAREHITGDGWDGTAYIRWFTCPKEDVPTHRASGGELANGAVLPVKWGGVATSNAYDPRLQECVDTQPEGAAVAILRTVWIEINVS